MILPNFYRVGMLALLVLTAYGAASGQSGDSSFTMFPLKDGTLIGGICLTQQPVNDGWVVFTPSARFRRFHSKDIWYRQFTKTDSSTLSRMRAKLTNSLATIELQDSAILNDVYPMDIVNDTLLNAISAGRMISIEHRKILRISFPRNRSYWTFRRTGFYLGAAVVGTAGFFWGKEEIPFGSEEKHVKSANQIIVGGIYNCILGIIVGGVGGYSAGLLADNAFDQRVSEDFEGLNQEGRLKILQNLISAYSD